MTSVASILIGLPSGPTGGLFSLNRFLSVKRTPPSHRFPSPVSSKLLPAIPGIRIKGSVGVGVGVGLGDGGGGGGVGVAVGIGVGVGVGVGPSTLIVAAPVAQAPR